MCSATQIARLDCILYAARNGNRSPRRGRRARTQSRRVFGARSTRCRCCCYCCCSPVNGRLTSLTRRGSPGMARNAPPMCFSRENRRRIGRFSLPFLGLLVARLLLHSPFSSRDDGYTSIKMSQLVIRRRART